MGFEFANPALLFGTLLFGVPLIIHLLNRRRYKVKKWAAFDFLMAAHKRTRRRLQLENFLLLLLRCLIVMLLAVALAKPFVSSQSAAAALSSIRRDVVIVLDHSYSMGYALTPDETCYDLARKKIRGLLSRLDETRGDTVTLILMEHRPVFVVPYQSSPSDAMVKLDRLLTPSLKDADFSTLVDLLAGELSENIEGQKEVFIFTDLQARTLNAGAGEERTATAAKLNEAVSQGAVITFVDVGPQSIRPRNSAVIEVGTLDSYVTTDRPTTFVATVQNFSEQEIPDCRGSFYLDGQLLESRSLALAARGKAGAECSLVLAEPGPHHIAFRLEGDALPQDDVRWHAFEARQTVRVLLVDGHFHEDSDLSGTGELVRVIDPYRIDGGVEQGTLFDPQVVDLRIFNTGQKNLDNYECVMLADTPGLTGEMAEALHQYVQSGGSLVLFMGPHVDLETLNQRLLGEGETDLLPARLMEVMGEEAGRTSVDYFKFSAVDFSHPLFALFRDPRYRPLLEVPVFRFVRMQEPGEEARVLARFSGPLEDSYPAVIEQSIGQGRVVFFATSASSDWSLIPESPMTFLPLVHNLLYHVTAKDLTRHNLDVGAVIRRSVVEFPEKISLLFPSGAREEVSDSVEQREFGRYLLPLTSRELSEEGPYTLEVAFTLSGKTLQEGYVANIDPSEGDLYRLDGQELGDLFPDADLKVVETPWVEDSEGSEEGRKGEFWQPLLIALLVLVGLELVLSWKFGNYR